MSGIPPSYFQCDLKQLESQWQAYKARSGIPAMTDKQRIADLERRVKELEQRPPVFQPIIVPVPSPLTAPYLPPVAPVPYGPFDPMPMVPTPIRPWCPPYRVTCETWCTPSSSSRSGYGPTVCG